MRRAHAICRSMKSLVVITVSTVYAVHQKNETHMTNKLEERYVHFVHNIANMKLDDETCKELLRAVIESAKFLHNDLLAGGYGK
jgi:predicted Ser/Thr protein kinase